MSQIKILRRKLKTTKILVSAVFIVLALSYHKKGQLVDYHQVKSNLHKDPIQSDTNKKDITLNYKGTQYLIHPVQEYEIAGLVVSHNNPTGWGDIYHDENSFDTLDVCLIWGDNLRNNDFQKVKYWNVSWTCNIRYPLDIDFHFNQLSNNHLITTKDEIRKQIGKIKVGDQILIKGSLVNYTSLTSESSWRNSSLTRDDTGNGACEVVLVDSLLVLKKGTPGWYFLFTLSKWILGIGIILLFFLFVKLARLEGGVS